MVKKLKPGDGISHEESTVERRNYTDKQAQSLGYPNAEVLRLSDELSALAGEWRTTKSDNVASRYRETLLTMILKGYDVDTLPVQDQLPDDLMPELPHPRVREAIQKVFVELTN
ncbi:MAG: hypothetical protein AAFN11_01585 [Chloroflexota bacterium]